MAQINLAPGNQYLIITRRRRRLIYGLSAAIAATALAVGVVLSVITSRAEQEKQSLQQQVQRLETQIAQASDQIKKIQLFEQRLVTLGDLLANHRTWTPYLQELERLLPPDAILTSLQGDHSSGRVELAGSTANIDNAATALASLKNEAGSHATLFHNGTITNVQRAKQPGPAGPGPGERYSFTMSLSIAPAASEARPVGRPPAP